jgi:hypothetical protein
MRIALVVLHLALVIGCSEQADDTGPTAFSGRAVPEDAEVVHAKEVLQVFVDERAGAGEHHFCIVGIEGASDWAAWVHWREGNRLILWEPLDSYPGDPLLHHDLLASRRSLDLAKDAVPDPEDVGTSTYLVTRAWAESVIDTCSRVGLKVAVEKGGD